MKKQIVLASSNLNKLKEIRRMLEEEHSELNVVAQTEFGLPEIIETGLTFVENAILKARHACQNTGLAAIADDSGLVIDALNGEPGVYSSRYSSLATSDADNVAKVLTMLQDIPQPQRSARFFSIIVFMRHAADPAPIICQGIWEGSILFSARGQNGFGYDPIFYVTSHACSAAELPPEVKNQLSHRGQALRKLLAIMKTIK
jgi:XTP/dITP diphosphohydrolase